MKLSVWMVVLMRLIPDRLADICTRKDTCGHHGGVVQTANTEQPKQHVTGKRTTENYTAAQRIMGRHLYKVQTMHKQIDLFRNAYRCGEHCTESKGTIKFRTQLPLRKGSGRRG